MSGMHTPPGTTLSTPSPTERQSPGLEVEMTAARAPIYLIVATAVNPPLGIGLRGTLPWGSLPSDMAFFRKVTSGKDKILPSPSRRPKLNKVIMGRKTWVSIPPKFRPLAGRLNVVVTRSDIKGLASKILEEMNSKTSPSGQNQGNKFELDTTSSGNVAKIKDAADDTPAVAVTDSISAAVDIEGGDAFCIGGAEIYSLLLRDPTLRPRLRILQTQVKKNDGSTYECDTFWPEEMAEGKEGWHEVSSEEIKSWTGVDVPQGSQIWFKDSKAQAFIRVRGWRQKSPNTT